MIAVHRLIRAVVARRIFCTQHGIRFFRHAESDIRVVISAARLGDPGMVFVQGDNLLAVTCPALPINNQHAMNRLALDCAIARSAEIRSHPLGFDVLKISI